MQEFFEIVGFLVLAGAAAFGVSFLLFRFPLRRAKQMLEPGALVRIKTTVSMHRTRFSRRLPNGLVFAAPLQRDAHVPISIGETVTVEAPMNDGVLLFRSKVVARDLRTHEIVLSHPQQLHKEDRREVGRLTPKQREITVEESPAWLIDLSTHGARFARNGALDSGERIRLDLADGLVYGWVLSCSPNHDEGGGSHLVRVRFEEPVPISIL